MGHQRISQCQFAANSAQSFRPSSVVFDQTVSRPWSNQEGRQHVQVLSNPSWPAGPLDGPETARTRRDSISCRTSPSKLKFFAFCDEFHWLGTKCIRRCMAKNRQRDYLALSTGLLAGERPVSTTSVGPQCLPLLGRRRRGGFCRTTNPFSPVHA